MAISVTIDRNAWKETPALDRVARAATRAALAVAGLDARHCDLSIAFADDATVACLNRQWRAMDKPTNVLSFPAAARSWGGRRYLGDIVLAAGVVAAEARGQGKKLSHHVSHLIVHGVLHLLGHDHQKIAAARKMEQMEISALATLGISDPYHGNWLDRQPN
jgi:probable rRNA maturation factor